MKFKVELERRWSGAGVEREWSDSAMIEWSEAFERRHEAKGERTISEVSPLSEVRGSQIITQNVRGPMALGVTDRRWP